MLVNDTLVDKIKRKFRFFLSEMPVFQDDFGQLLLGIQAKLLHGPRANDQSSPL